MVDQPLHDFASCPWYLGLFTNTARLHTRTHTHKHTSVPYDLNKKKNSHSRRHIYYTNQMLFKEHNTRFIKTSSHTQKPNQTHVQPLPKRPCHMRLDLDMYFTYADGHHRRIFASIPARPVAVSRRSNTWDVATRNNAESHAGSAHKYICIL